MLINAFAKVKVTDERFVTLAEAVTKLEQNLTNIEKHHARLLKGQVGLAADLRDFGTAFGSFGQIETQVSDCLNTFGNRLVAYAQDIADKVC